MSLKASNSFREKNGVVKNLMNIFERRNSSDIIKVDKPKLSLVTNMKVADQNPTNKIKKVFKIFDKNGSGHFNKNQLMEIMHSFGLHVRTSEIDLILKEVKMDENGNISFIEFVNLFEDIENEKTEFENDLRETFSIFDKEKNGYISVADLGLVLNNFGLNLSDIELKEMIAEADTDKDELISFYDLMMLLCSEEDETEDCDTPNSR